MKRVTVEERERLRAWYERELSGKNTLHRALRTIGCFLLGLGWPMVLARVLLQCTEPPRYAEPERCIEVDCGPVRPHPIGEAGALDDAGFVRGAP